eukprot:scaffold12649_cov41-Attheya_sp.AAC.1
MLEHIYMWSRGYNHPGEINQNGSVFFSCTSSHQPVTYQCQTCQQFANLLDNGMSKYRGMNNGREEEGK